MKKIDALILDAGGVLVRPVHGDWNIPARYRELLGPLAPEVGGPRWRRAALEAAELLREDVYMTELDAERQVRRAYLEKMAGLMGWTLSGSALDALAEDFTFNPDRYIWYSDVEAALGRLRTRLRLGMLSDALPSFKGFTLGRGMDRYFQVMVFSTQLGACKPDARMYAAICQKMDVAPQACLFVDDKPCNLTGAMDFGMAAVQMCRDGLRPWAGDFVRSLTELESYLEDRT